MGENDWSNESLAKRGGRGGKALLNVVAHICRRTIGIDPSEEPLELGEAVAIKKVEEIEEEVAKRKTKRR